MTVAFEIEQPLIQNRGLPILIHDLIKGYVTRSAKEKVDNEQSREYWEKREKICMNAFYRLRACKNRQDFLVYFTGTLCSVPQFIRAEEYQQIAEHLTQNWEDVKSLAMLALSKFSYHRLKPEQDNQLDENKISKAEEGDK